MNRMDIITRRIVVSILVLFGIVSLVFVVILVKTFWPHYVFLEGSEKCIYHYEYINYEGARSQDAVELSSEHCQMLANIIAEKPFREALDVEKGLTPMYSLEFFDVSGDSTMILIQYVRDGRIRINGTIWDREIEGRSRELFFSTLEGYHRHDQIIVGG